MKISIVTPSFNQARFLPFNLLSVDGQKGVQIEHIIVDPGSTDGSTEIARKAKGVILLAEPDRGQSDGICKGFARSTGDVLAWLNSDDCYPDSQVAFDVLNVFQNNPDVDVVYGGVNFVDERGSFLRKGFVNPGEDKLLPSFEYQVGIVQPGVFIRRRVFEMVGGPSEEYEYCMDYEYWVRIAKAGFKWKYVPRIFAHHRWWGGMKTSSRRDLSLREHFKVCARYFGYVHWKWLDRYAEFLCTKQDGVVNHAGDIDPHKKAKSIRQAIDEVITQDMLGMVNQSSEPEKIATRQYIERNYPEKTRICFGESELEIASEVADDPKAMERKAWHIFIAKTADGKNYAAYHVPGNFDRYCDARWHERQLERSRQGLAMLASSRKGDTCVIVGNGPSLRKSDLSLLVNVDAIMSNFAVMSKELSRYGKILTVVNDLVARQGAIDFNAVQLFKIVPFWLANYFNDDENTFYVSATVRPEFTKDFVSAASWRSTVSFFNMQLAYALGYKKVVLIGFDHSYVQPKDVVEGQVISQKEDDENHFDPRYFKGKDWQAADTSNMEKMYLLAKAAFESNGREIVNCTVGGKLEVFRRGDLATELGCIGKTIALREQCSRDNAAHYPRLLIVDPTSVGSTSATGQIKQVFVDGWPEDRLMQVYQERSTFRLKNWAEGGQKSGTLTDSELLAACRQFGPDALYFRPVESEQLFAFAERVVQDLAVPLVIHMMDDWPERLKVDDPENFLKMDCALKRLLDVAAGRLSICQKMSDVYLKRYGHEFVPLANGVDVDEITPKDWSIRTAVTEQCPFLIRYMGAMADDMSFESVADIARTVSTLSYHLPVRFEIYTMPWFLEKAKSVLSGLRGVQVAGLVPAQDYRKSLSEADALLIAYNFDAASVRYTSLSMANKLPEVLASGAAVIAYGPTSVATIAHLENAKCARLVTARSADLLANEITYLAANLEACRDLGVLGRDHVRHFLSKNMVKDRFRQEIARAVENSKPIARYLVGPYSRADNAYYDETTCVAELLSLNSMCSTMIDVGAHHGWALSPFLDQGWKIYAFEPDEKNRQKLLERLAKHQKSTLVKLDSRAVSNESKKGLSFYRSEESTGISGLSAFHPSHKAEQTVDAVTLAEALAGEKLEAVDFLKIDTEGHDLFVLKGFPWERFRPAVIECEFEDSKTVPLGYTFHDLAKYLVEKGYTVYVSEWHPIIRYGIRHDWHRLVRYPCELADPKGWGNLLAFRDPIDEAMLVAAANNVMKIGSEPAKVARSAMAVSAPPTTSPASQQPIATKKPQPPLVARHTIAMGRPIVGANWSDPVMVNGMSARLVASGQRATMALSLKRDQDLLILMTLPPRSSRDHYDGVRLEIDGTVVLHTLHLDINPPCLVASVPAIQAAQNHVTEVAILVPSRTGQLGVTDGRHTGLAVAKVSVIPAFPKNHAHALTVGKPWYQRFASRLNKKPLAFPFSHFDGLAYVEANPDVAEAILGGRLSSGLFHYQRYGRSEGRAYAIALQNNPSIGGLAEIFDGQAYLKTYPDIAEAVRCGMRSSALEHYMQYGRNEGRRARLRFDGTSRRGTALDLVELETLRTAKAATEAIRVSISKEVAKQVGQLSSELTRIGSVLQAKLDQLAKEQNKQQAALVRAEAQDADLRRELRDGMSRSARAAELARVEQLAVRNAERMLLELGTTKKDLEQTVVQQEQMSRSLATVQKQQDTQNARLTHPNSYAFNGLGYQAFPRQLTKANAERLARHWAPMLGQTVQEKELFYLAHRICQTENACLGRLATSIDSVMLRILVARAFGGRELDVLEIGTLFGLGVIALHEAIKPVCEGLHFTVIDPLDGYYGKEHRDILTGVPISRAVFDENLRRAGMTQHDVTVIQQLSTDERALLQARASQYAVLIIDGDHRYAGVKHDFESYLCTVMPGGYVILDDYGNPNWPDVKAYVDAEVMGRKDLECLGTDWHTAVFRVRNER